MANINMEGLDLSNQPHLDNDNGVSICQLDSLIDPICQLDPSINVNGQLDSECQLDSSIDIKSQLDPLLSVTEIIYVIKRDFNRQQLNPDKLYARIGRIVETVIRDVRQNQNDSDSCLEYFLVDDPTERIVSSTLQALPNIATSSEIDEIAARISANFIIDHIYYDNVAARIAISKLHKETKTDFSKVMETLYINNVITQTFYHCVLQSNVDEFIHHHLDFKFTYFGFKTLERMYLLRIDDKVVERPQHMFMRVALGLNKNSKDDCVYTYSLLSNFCYTHGSPTIFNMGTSNYQYASCFLMSYSDDNLTYEYPIELINKCFKIAMAGGGIGLDLNGLQNNYLLRILEYLNITLEFTKQINKLKRPGGIAAYVEVWHHNIYEFLHTKSVKNTRQHRSLFYGLLIPDLFMKRWHEDGDWCLFDTVKFNELHHTYGYEFECLYEEFEKAELYTEKIRARDLWSYIVRSSIETGGPYIIYKDSVNRKNNQKKLGTITCSNLCTEIMEFTSQTEIAVCNIASVSLPACIIHCNPPIFDFWKLKTIVNQVTKNLNHSIDESKHLFEESQTSNTSHRPIGIGVQGLADLFAVFRCTFDSDEAKDLNRKIFETIYYAALQTSCELAKQYGTYSSYPESPASEGTLQFDFWDNDDTGASPMWDWTTLRENIKQNGLRNSLLTTVMPTATTAQILGNQESIKPFFSNLFIRRVHTGEFQIVNKYLAKDLMTTKLWSKDLIRKILVADGSISQIEEIPDELKNLYKTVWEIKQKTLIDLAIQRQPYIDQSQSLNFFMETPTYSKLSSAHFYAWKNGLKTGMYYLRQKPKSRTMSFVLPQQYEHESKILPLETCC